MADLSPDSVMKQIKANAAAAHVEGPKPGQRSLLSRIFGAEQDRPKPPTLEAQSQQSGHGMQAIADRRLAAAEARIPSP